MKLLVCLLLILLIPQRLSAGAQEEWRYILSLDAGPKKKPATRDEAALLARNHLLLQRKAVEQFLARYPGDPQAFEAKLKLARILAAEGKIANNQSEVDEALRLLGELEKAPGVARERLADAGFARASLLMQTQNGNAERVRESIVWSARAFTAKYPGDRRGPRMLVEAGTVCDDVPKQKRDLLEEAFRLTDEEPLKRRIADDLRSTRIFGKAPGFENDGSERQGNRPCRAPRICRRADFLVGRLPAQFTLAAGFSLLVGDSTEGSNSRRDNQSR